MPASALVTAASHHALPRHQSRHHVTKFRGVALYTCMTSYHEAVSRYEESQRHTYLSRVMVHIDATLQACQEVMLHYSVMTSPCNVSQSDTSQYIQHGDTKLHDGVVRGVRSCKRALFTGKDRDGVCPLTARSALKADRERVTAIRTTMSTISLSRGRIAVYFRVQSAGPRSQRPCRKNSVRRRPKK